MNGKVSSSLVPLSVTGLLVIALLVHGPIHQFADYHDFADQRLVAGIPHIGDVLSNLGFLLVGIYGLLQLARAPQRTNTAPYWLFFLGLVLTAIGSAVYHLAPGDERLVLDRVPIALACTALLGTVMGSGWLLPLAAMGVASVFWWSFKGDLGPYVLVQLLPLVVVPLVQWQAGAPRAERQAFAFAIALYVAAKGCELADHQIYDALGLVSGHTLKHLLAALASFVLARSFLRSVAGPVRR